MKTIFREESLKEIQRKNLYLQLIANWTHFLKVHLGEGVKIGHRQRERKKVSWEQCNANVKKEKY